MHPNKPSFALSETTSAIIGATDCSKGFTMGGQEKKKGKRSAK
jgi:hypothetical protein